MPSSIEKACAVCARPLDRFDPPDGSPRQYLHFQDLDLDHVVVPVDPHEVTVVYRCDFCNTDDDVNWQIVVDDFKMIAGTSRGDWAACEACAELVKRKRWSNIVSRVRASLPVHLRAGRADLLDTYARLDRHMHDVIPIVRYGPAEER